MQTKQETKQKLKAVLIEWHEALATAIKESSDSYETIARQVGTSQQFIYRLAKERGIRRERDARVAEEVSNG